VTDINITITKFYQELKRRRVINTALLYIVACWIIIQVISDVFPALAERDDYVYYALALFILGLVLTIFISWFYQITPQGIIKVPSFTERRRLNNVPPTADRRIALKKVDHGDLPTSGWSIFAETGPLENLEYPVNGTVTAGRALECEVTLLRSYISRKHAKFFLDERQLLIEDLNSSNGTRVNGVLISSPHELHHGDEVSFKDVVFRVKEDRSQFKDEAMLNQTTIIVK
jgi:hypothetical protein